MLRIYVALLLALACLSTCTKNPEPPIPPDVEIYDTTYVYPPLVLYNCRWVDTLTAGPLPPLQGWTRRVIPVPGGGAPWFFNRQEGFMCTTYGSIFKTADGGNTWIELYKNPELWIQQASFTSPQHGVLLCAINNKICFLTTYDGGANWTLQETEILQQSFSWISLKFFAPDLGYWADLLVPGLRVTKDSCQTWDTYVINFDNVNTVQSGAVDYYNRDTFYVMGLGGLILRSTNSGKNWTSASVPFVYTTNVKFFDSQMGYIYGPEGVAITRNGGASWKVISRRNTNFAHILPNGEAVFYQMVAECFGKQAWAFVTTKDYGDTWEVGSFTRDMVNLHNYQFVSDSTFMTYSFVHGLIEYYKQ